MSELGKWGKKERESFLSNQLKGEPSSWDGAIDTEFMWEKIEKIVEGDIDSVGEYLEEIKEELLFWLSLAAIERIGAVQWEYKPRLLLKSEGE